MGNELATQSQNPDAGVLEQVIIGGDLSKLTPEQRVSYYMSVCHSLGLNPQTRPFEYIQLNGRLTLYARKDATDQLRSLRGISIEKPEITYQDTWIIVTVTGHDTTGRTDSEIGVVSKTDMRGDFGNALMKAVTKAKRRLTLSMCGLGWLDETEVETVPTAIPVKVDDAGEIMPTITVTTPAKHQQPAQQTTQQTTQQQNGQRPYQPRQLFNRLAEIAGEKQGKKASPAQRGLAVGVMNTIFGGDESKRKEVLFYLTGFQSFNDVSDQMVLAILDWLAPTKDSGGAYEASPMATREAFLVLNEVAKANGMQTGLFGEEE